MCSYFDILMNVCINLAIKTYNILQIVQENYLYFLT